MHFGTLIHTNTKRSCTYIRLLLHTSRCHELGRLVDEELHPRTPWANQRSWLPFPPRLNCVQSCILCQSSSHCLCVRTCCPCRLCHWHTALGPNVWFPSAQSMLNALLIHIVLKQILGMWTVNSPCWNQLNNMATEYCIDLFCSSLFRVVSLG